MVAPEDTEFKSKLKNLASFANIVDFTLKACRCDRLFSRREGHSEARSCDVTRAFAFRRL